MTNCPAMRGLWPLALVPHIVGGREVCPGSDVRSGSRLGG